MVKTLERDRYALCEKHVIVPFCCSYQVYRYLAGCFGLISGRHYLKIIENELWVQTSLRPQLMNSVIVTVDYMVNSRAEKAGS